MGEHTNAETIGHYVAGELRLDDAGGSELIDPYSGEAIGALCEAPPELVDQALRVAADARAILAGMPIHQRAELLRDLAVTLRDHQGELAETIVADMGKPRREADLEVLRAAEVAELTASAALGLDGRIVPMSASPLASGRLGFEIPVPAGVVIAIAPFNAPLNLTTSKVVAAVGAGCPVVVKPPPQSPRPALRLAELMSEVGWPVGAIGVCNGGRTVGERLVSSEVPRVVTFTGSASGGKAVARSAGLKRLILELGSMASTVICEDAPVEEAAKQLTRGAFGTSGQACISTQRILVHHSVREAFLDRFIPAVESLQVGDPRDLDTDVGPLINDDAAARIGEWLQEAQEQGSTVLAGGGFHGPRMLAPTVLTNVPRECKVATNEVFGPVVEIRDFSDDPEAAKMANETPYGLQAGVFTNSLEKALYFAEHLEFGGIQVNDSSRVRHDIHAFGGFKDSGIGKEGVTEALHAMTETKFVGLRRLTGS